MITHPDYLVGRRERDVYLELLRHLTDLRERQRLMDGAAGRNQSVVAKPARR